MNLSSVDLNLLVAFDALMAERHVSRAALRLGRTQSGLSHALSRLRALFQDELFVRGPRGMIPTSRALALRGPIRTALEGIASAITGDEAFIPETATRRFTIGVSDYTSFLFLSGIIQAIQQTAPGVHLLARHVNKVEGPELVLSGELDLALGNYPGSSLRLKEEVLYNERVICAARRGHPAMKKKLTLEGYLASHHLQVSINGDPVGLTDEILARQEKVRHIAAVVPYYMVVPAILEKTDLVATVSERIPVLFEKTNKLALADTPFEFPPIPIAQIYDQRFESDEGHAWLRSIISQVVAPPRAKRKRGRG